MAELFAEFAVAVIEPVADAVAWLAACLWHTLTVLGDFLVHVALSPFERRRDDDGR